MTLTQHQRHWGVDQWGAYLATRELPCMPRSKQLLRSLETEVGDDLSPRQLADIAHLDPFLCLRLLREAERRRTHTLGHDTTTILAAVLQLGLRTFRRLVEDSPEADETNPGLLACDGRAVLASQLAVLWSSARADISPDEVGMATLMADTGELLLWAFAPELPQACADYLASGEAHRSAEAQQHVCGFHFHDLTVKCAELWSLPSLLTHLIRGVDNVRANICRLSIDTARHLTASFDNPALPHDLAAAHKLIPHASLEWLAARMPGLNEERQAEVVAAAGQLAEH
jgi:HD-like signal output (HDOD) protein